MIELVLRLALEIPKQVQRGKPIEVTIEVRNETKTPCVFTRPHKYTPDRFAIEMSGQIEGVGTTIAFDVPAEELKYYEKPLLPGESLRFPVTFNADHTPMLPLCRIGTTTITVVLPRACTCGDVISDLRASETIRVANPTRTELNRRRELLAGLFASLPDSLRQLRSELIFFAQVADPEASRLIEAGRRTLSEEMQVLTEVTSSCRSAWEEGSTEIE